MAQNGHACSIAQCPLLGAKRKTYARVELFRFWTQRRHLSAKWHNPSDGDLPSYKRSASLDGSGWSVCAAGSRRVACLDCSTVGDHFEVEGEGTGWRAFPADAILGGERHFGRRLV